MNHEQRRSFLGIDAGHHAHTKAFSATVSESFNVPFQILPINYIIILPEKAIYSARKPSKRSVNSYMYVALEEKRAQNLS
jgi:hypothetical protein